jgi:hypothetical protein
LNTDLEIKLLLHLDMLELRVIAYHLKTLNVLEDRRFVSNGNDDITRASDEMNAKYPDPMVDLLLMTDLKTPAKELVRSMANAFRR